MAKATKKKKTTKTDAAKKQEIKRVKMLLLRQAGEMMSELLLRRGSVQRDDIASHNRLKAKYADKSNAELFTEAKRKLAEASSKRK